MIVADKERRPVVVITPLSLREKWPRDFALFRERCLPAGLREIRCGSADSAVQFLKLLDDPPDRKRSLLFVTHGAMSRGLTDCWVKLALIHRALYRRQNTERLRRALDRVMGQLLRAAFHQLDGTGKWERLLSKDPADWLRELRRMGIHPESEWDVGTEDDPVPAVVREALAEMRGEATAALYDALQSIPLRQSTTMKQRVTLARQRMKERLDALRADCLEGLKNRLKLPLLILDEAHHLKNPQTKLASLFQDPDADADASQLGSGVLAGVFERMLFLTATPFQLGHRELCEVLERFSGVDWKGPHAPADGLADYEGRMGALRTALDKAQISALALDRAWGRLRLGDLVANGKSFVQADDWWEQAQTGSSLTTAAHDVVARYREAAENLGSADALLKPWVIRHLKPRRLPGGTGLDPRRLRVAGAGDNGGQGIPIDGEAVLPFLLAARASFQAPESRPVFAEGLASSFEAFLDTRRRSEGVTDEDDESRATTPASSSASWYLDQLEALLPRGDWRTSLSHPKVSRTVERTLDLWSHGEKVVVFCHYKASCGK